MPIIQIMMAQEGQLRWQKLSEDVLKIWIPYKNTIWGIINRHRLQDLKMLKIAKGAKEETAKGWARIYIFKPHRTKLSRILLNFTMTLMLRE